MSDDDERRTDYASRPKQRQFSKRPARPDFTERDTKLSTLQAKAKEYSDLAKAKAAELEALQNENKASNRLESLKGALANAQHSRVQSQKLYDMTKKRLNDMNNPKAVKGPQVKGIDSSMGPQDILNRMEQLKERISQEPDQDEANRIIARIQALNASYVQLMGSDAAAGPNNGSAGGSVKASLESDLQKHESDLKAAQTKEEDVRSQLDELRGKLDEAQPHIERLKKERETCLDVARKLRDSITSINAEWQEKFDTYKAQMDAWVAEKDKVMKERNEQKKQEQAEREAERARREKEARGPPFRDHIVACEQVFAWCKQYEQSAATPASAAPGDANGAGPSDGAAPAGFEGMVMRGKKADENEDAFSTSRTKSKNKGRRAGRSSADGRKESGKINHDMDMLALFSKLRLSVPTNIADVPPIAETVAARKKDYEEKQRKALEAGEDAPVEEDPATPTIAQRGGVAASSNSAENGTAAGPVSLSLRCDEAFGTVLVELMAH